MRAVRLLIPLLGASLAMAHIPLTPAIIDDAFEEIAEARAAAETAEDADARAAAYYELAVASTKLMELLNQEVRLHGTEQLDLLHDTVITANSRGVEIIWSPAHEQYFYKGAAFRQYLEIRPGGLNAANSLYHLIETGFYLGDPADRNALLGRIEMERDFLARFSGVGRAGDVAMFLAVDYRDLWRLCDETGDNECADRYSALNREHLAATIAGNDERASKLARSFLARFESEIEGVR